MAKAQPAGAIDRWSSLHGAVFENPHNVTGAGQQEYTGLSVEGDNIYNEYLARAKAARACPVKRKFEKDHLVLFKAKMNIECGSYEEDDKRRKRNSPKEGIAQDNDADRGWDDSALYPDESSDDDSDDDN